jgi:molybdopterin synthase catalytic subunit
MIPMEPELFNPMKTTGTAQKIFIRGSIASSFITRIIVQQSRNRDMGATSIFLGHVRSDEWEGSRVKAIEYTANEGMANEKFTEIQTELFLKYPVTRLCVYHSLGTVQAGEICFFVLAVSGHRREAIQACNEAVERIKAELAIWGKLLLENGTSKWKENY